MARGGAGRAAFGGTVGARTGEGSVAERRGGGVPLPQLASSMANAEMVIARVNMPGRFAPDCRDVNVGDLQALRGAANRASPFA